MLAVGQRRDVRGGLRSRSSPTASCRSRRTSPTRTYYKENVCFDVFGANSSYNWELFFHAPLYIATRLSKNGRYEEAMKWFHYIFDPTTDAQPGPGESATARYWKVLPFKTTAPPTWRSGSARWRRTPTPTSRTRSSPSGATTRSTRIASAANRPLAYMKHVVIQYVENLVAWGDSLFRRYTMRKRRSRRSSSTSWPTTCSGRGREFVPRRGEIDAESYASLETSGTTSRTRWSSWRTSFPYSQRRAASATSTPGTSLLGVGSALYFCIPPNEELLEHWDTRGGSAVQDPPLPGHRRRRAPARAVRAADRPGRAHAGRGAGPEPRQHPGRPQQPAADLPLRAPAPEGERVLRRRARRSGSRCWRPSRSATPRSSAACARRTRRDARAHDRGARAAGAGRQGEQGESPEGARGGGRAGSSTTWSCWATTIDRAAAADDLARRSPRTASCRPTRRSRRSPPDADTALVDSGETGVKVIGKEKEELDLNLAAKWVTVGRERAARSWRASSR